MKKKPTEHEVPVDYHSSWSSSGGVLPCDPASPTSAPRTPPTGLPETPANEVVLEWTTPTNPESRTIGQEEGAGQNNSAISPSADLTSSLGLISQDIQLNYITLELYITHY